MTTERESAEVAGQAALTALWDFVADPFEFSGDPGKTVAAMEESWLDAQDRIDSLTSRLSEAERENERLKGFVGEHTRVCLPRLSRLEEALERIAETQPKVLAYIKREGFIFATPLHESKGWEKLAFSIYTDLCEVDSIAAAALQQEGERPKPRVGIVHGPGDLAQRSVEQEDR